MEGGTDGDERRMDWKTLLAYITETVDQAFDVGRRRLLRGGRQRGREHQNEREAESAGHDVS